MFVEDQTGTLTQQQVKNLEGMLSRFDVKVLVSSGYSKSALDAKVGQMVTSGNTVAIGVDPVHRYTFTHFGTETGLARSEFQVVARAGNAQFKGGDWAGGIETITRAANTAQAERVAAVVVQPQTVVEKSVSAWPFVIGFGSITLAVGGIVWWWNRRQKEVVADFQRETAEAASNNIKAWDREPPKARTSAAPPTRHPAPLHRNPPPLRPSHRGEVHHHHHHGQANSNNDLALGIALGQMNQPAPVVVVREEAPRPRSITPPSTSSSSSYDSGWSSGSGGGGFDSGGGGGFDGGGGGGDF